MNTNYNNEIYSDISKEFGINKPLSTSEIKEIVSAYAMLSDEDKRNLILNSRRSNKAGFIL